MTEKMKQDILHVLETTNEDFEKLDLNPTTFTFHQESGEIVGQAINSNDADEILKIIHEVKAPFLAQIEQLKEENRFLRNLVERKN